MLWNCVKAIHFVSEGNFIMRDVSNLENVIIYKLSNVQLTLTLQGNWKRREKILRRKYLYIAIETTFPTTSVHLCWWNFGRFQLYFARLLGFWVIVSTLSVVFLSTRSNHCVCWRLSLRFPIGWEKQDFQTGTDLSIISTWKSVQSIGTSLTHIIDHLYHFVRILSVIILNPSLKRQRLASIFVLCIFLVMLLLEVTLEDR